uniref:Uncharacterized protein n=1 Tax=Pithovirus LCPAC401 TaxID=2506595 RepID=A0A481Z9C4_9VIRU|nr:MAG: hypothetical protein LCPAC401_01160 [Pithovirus LCPAC401]
MTLPFSTEDIDTFIFKVNSNHQNRYGLYTIKIDGKNIIVLESIDNMSYLLKHFVTKEGQLTLSQALNWFIDKYPDITFGLVKTNRTHILIGFDVKKFDTSTEIQVHLYYVDYGKANVLTLTIMNKEIDDFLNESW